MIEAQCDHCTPTLLLEEPSLFAVVMNAARVANKGVEKTVFLIVFLQ